MHSRTFQLSHEAPHRRDPELGVTLEELLAANADLLGTPVSTDRDGWPDLDLPAG